MLFIDFPNRFHHSSRTFRRCSESHAALFDVWTGNIQFNAGNMCQRLNDFGRFHIVFDGRTRYIYQNVRIKVHDAWINGFGKVMNTLILQSHSV